MAQEKERAKIWAVSTYEYYGGDIDTLTSYAYERFKFYKYGRDAYNFILSVALRAYCRFVTAERIRTVGRPVVKYSKGAYRETEFMQFAVEVKWDDGCDELEMNRMIYEAVTEKLF